MSAVRDAAFRMVRNYPGGALSLAPRLGKTHATLSHEVAGHPSYKLGIDDAVSMSVLSGDLSVLNAFAAEVGCMVLPIGPLPNSGGDVDVMHKLAATAKEFGDFMTVIAKGLDDRKVSPNELRDAEREWGELVACGQSVVAHMRVLHDTLIAQRAGASGLKG